MLAKPKQLGKLQTYVRVGTCSWKYDSWKGLVYRADSNYQPYDYLSDYAEYFNTVEIDQWFWSLFPKGVKLPNPETVRIYAESVPDDFLFTVKAPNSITLTHYYSKQPKGLASYADQPNANFMDPDLLTKFLELLKPIHSKLGPVMFQFEYLNRKKMPSLNAFLDQLSSFFEKVPTGFNYAVEIRNPNYLKTELSDFLKKSKIGFVLLEGYYMPPIDEVASQIDTATADFSVIRLHGPDRQKIDDSTGGDWNRIVEPKETGLHTTANLIQENADKGITTFVNVNNHYEGCAPLTIDRLITQL